MHGRSINKDNRCCISRIYQCFGHDYRLVAKNECRHLSLMAVNLSIRASSGGKVKHSTWRRP